MVHAVRRRRVLHAGCGAYAPGKLHPVFRGEAWAETRLDIDSQVQPDIVCSIHDMSLAIPSRSYDALWSSHNIEHLHAHEVANAFREFFRILKPDGFALIRCPDLEAVADILLRKGPDHPAYMSPAGPITALDMIYGHSASVARGHTSMRHHTGFTAERLGRLLLKAGFMEIHTKRAVEFDLWAVAFMPDVAPAPVLADLARGGLTFDG